LFKQNDVGRGPVKQQRLRITGTLLSANLPCQFTEWQI
jgi:hypothetical protein